MLKNAIWIFIIALGVLVAFVPSYTRMQDFKQKDLEYSRQIQQLKHEKIDLIEEKRRLEEDPAYLERVAREKMGLIREGEVVYQIESGNTEE